MKRFLYLLCFMQTCILYAAASIPFLPELQKSTAFAPSQKQELISAWQTLHQIYKAKNSANPPATLTAVQAKAVAPLFTTNYLELMQQYLQDASNFTTLTKATEKNYATFHLAKAVARLDSVCDMSYAAGNPKMIFSGDVRDMGIIVNIKNNTQTNFAIIQSSLDGKIAQEIGTLVPGNNAVNLHTAALQNPATKNSPVSESSHFSFDFYEIGATNPTKIFIRLYTGAELVEFLETLPRKDKNVFQMNGMPTSPEYFANPKDYYMVLIQNPATNNLTESRTDQRIQAINISQFTETPYLLNIQINETTIETPSTVSNKFIPINIFQASLSTVILPKNEFANLNNFFLLILPQFLWAIPNLQNLWILQTSSLIAMNTNFKFLGKNSFGNTFAYFNNLGCFNHQNKYTFFLDLYNRFPPDGILYNAPWLIASAIYETKLNTCADIPQIYTAQDSYGHLTVNEKIFYYLIFKVILTPENLESKPILSSNFFNTYGFNIIYELTQELSHTMIVDALQPDIKAGIFGQLTLLNTNTYQLTWTNKKNQILLSQKITFDTALNSVQIRFVNETVGWIGSTLPSNLIPSKIGESTEFTVTYEFNPTNNKHILLAQKTSPIDKQEVFLPLDFDKYPIDTFYIDVFNKLNVSPFTRCWIIKDGILPPPLASLIAQDWQTGIYLIPIIKNNLNLSPTNPGALTLVFYKADKTMLGEVTIKGSFNNTAEEGIRAPIHAYNPHFSALNCQRDVYLSTGILLQYHPPI